MDSIVISGSGQTLLGLVPSPSAPPPSAPGRLADDERLVLVDVATGHQTFTDFRRVGRAQGLRYGLSTNEKYLAIAATTASQDFAAVTVTVTSVSERRVVAERVFNGAHMRSDAMDYQMQWSPSGEQLALWLYLPSASRESVLVLDSSTLETVVQFEGSQLAGSQSWSPDSQRLLILHDQKQELASVPDGRLQAIPWLKGIRGDPPRQPLVLALLDDHRALVQRQRGGRLRLSSVDLSTGKGIERADFTFLDTDIHLRMGVSRRWVE